MSNNFYTMYIFGMLFCHKRLETWAALTIMLLKGKICPSQCCAVIVLCHCSFSFFLKKIYLFYFLAVLGLHCCTQAFSSGGKQGLLFLEVCRLLITVTSLVVEHGL